MAQQIVNLGTGPDTAGADSHYVANSKHNANTTELYASVASKQDADATLTALSGISGTGIVTATATDTFAMRAIGAASGTDIPDRAAADARYAQLASPVLTGTPTAPTATAGTNNTQVATTAYVDGPVSLSTKTASYTLAAADAGTVVEMNVASANNLTVPPNATVAFPVGTIIEVCQIGAGATTIVAGAGVTVRTASSLVLRAQWSSAALRKRATNEWVLTGDLV